MRRPYLFLPALAATIALGSLSAFAQEPQFRGQDQFFVAAAEDTSILVEQNTGRTWMLTHSRDGNGQSVWLPIERIDEPDESRMWRREQQEIANLLERREREQDEERARDQEADERQQRVPELPDRRDIDNSRRELDRRRSEILQQQAATVREVLDHAQQKLEQQIDELRQRGAGEDVIERLQRLKENVQQKYEDVRRQPPDHGTVEDREADEGRERDREDVEEREVSERRRQLEQRRREQDQSSPERDESSEELGEIRRFNAQNQPALRELRQRVERLEQKFAETLDSKKAARKPSELLPLLIEKELILETRGPGHPAVRAIQKKIDVIERLRESAVNPADDSASRLRKEEVQPESFDFALVASAGTNLPKNNAEVITFLKTKTHVPEKWQERLRELRQEVMGLKISLSSNHPDVLENEYEIDAILSAYENLQGLLDGVEDNALQWRFFEQIIEERLLRHKYGPNHPRVLAARQQIQESFAESIE